MMSKNKRGIFLTGFFLFLFGILGLFASGRPRVTDEYMAYFQAQSFVWEGDFAVSQGVQFKNGYGKFGLDGRLYAPYGILHAWLMSPGIRAGEKFAVWAGIGEKWKHISSSWIAGFFSVLCLALLGVGSASLGLRQELKARQVLFWAGTLLFTTPLWTESGTFFSEPLSALFLFSAAAVLFLPDSDFEKWGEWGRVGAISFLTALNLWVRPNQIIFSLAFGLAVFFLPARNSKERFQSVLFYFLVQLAVILPLLYRNHVIHGNWREMGYPETAERGKALNHFGNPILKGMGAYLFSPGKAWLLYVPLLGAALYGAEGWRKSRPDVFVLILAIFIFPFLFFSKFSSFEGGYCYGPRFLLPALPVLWLGWLPLLQSQSRKIPRWIFFTTALFGFWVNLPAKLTSFLEEQVGGKKYYDVFFNYRMDHAAFWEQWKLTFHYFKITAEGRLGEISLGNGWDFGWYFWLKAGARPEAVSSVLVFLILMFSAGLLMMAFSLSSQEKV